MSEKISRSARLRKYEKAYKFCIKKDTNSVSIKSPYSKSDNIKEEDKKDKKKSLNKYQKFVREESKKSKYKNMSSSERMTAISKAWKNTK